MTTSQPAAETNRWASESRTTASTIHESRGERLGVLRAVLVGFLFVQLLVFPMSAFAGAGDLNDDGSINASDILLLERLLRGEDLSGLVPPLLVDARVADLSPYDSTNQLAMPDDSVDISDLVVLLARVAAGDQTIKQAPGSTTASYDSTIYNMGNPQPQDPTAGEYSQNPAFLTGTADPGAAVELWVNGSLQQTMDADLSGNYSFAVFLNAHPGASFDSFYTVSRNDDGQGIASQTFEVDYYDPVVRAACTADATLRTVALPLSNPPSTNITVSNQEYLVVARGVDQECNNTVSRVAPASITVESGATLAVLPGGILELKGEVGQPQNISVNGGTFLALGVSGTSAEFATVRGDFDGRDTFGKITLIDGAVGELRNAEILNSSGGFVVGRKTPTAIDTVDLSIESSYLGYRDLTDPVLNPSEGTGWLLRDLVSVPAIRLGFWTLKLLAEVPDLP